MVRRAVVARQRSGGALGRGVRSGPVRPSAASLTTAGPPGGGDAGTGPSSKNQRLLL